MKLSRTRKKDLKRLRSSAENLWQEQQQVLEHASFVAREARKQANLLTNEHVVPRVLSTYESRFKPSVDRGYSTGKLFATAARAKAVNEVFPAVAGVAASALSVLELTKGLRDRLDVAAVKAKGMSFGKAPEPVKKGGPGVGGLVLLSLGVVALAGVAYAAWQTFRADDDLWIADDEPEATGTVNPTDIPKDVPPTPTA
jgi:hypothetical protein